MTTPTPLAEVLTQAAHEAFQLPEGAARTLVEQMLQTAASLGHAGSEYYLPSLQHMTRAERNSRIRAEFNGQNLREICRRYGVSVRTVYYACRRPE